MPRKTANVDQIRSKANYYLANTSDTNDPTIVSPERRMGVASLLEQILQDTDNYKGFRYLDGYPCEDESRREYF